MSSENRSCRYDAGMVCFHVGDCAFPSLATCLQQNLYLAQKEIALLKERRGLKHNKASLKWRDMSFYYKKKAKALEAWIKEQGHTVPTIEEIFSKGESNESVCNVNTEATQSGSRNPGGDAQGDTSNKPSGQSLSEPPAGLGSSG